MNRPALFAFVLVAVGPRGWGADYDGLVARHAASRDLILNNLKCRVAVSLQNPDGSKADGITWTSECRYFGNKVRLSAVDYLNVRHQYYHCDGVLHQLTSNPVGPARETYMIRNHKSKFFVFYEPTAGGLLSVTLPNTLQQLALEDFVAAADTCRMAAAGRGGHTLTCDFKQGRAAHRVVVELDADHNDLIKRCTSTIEGKSGDPTTVTATVTKFSEIRPGVYFPTVAEMTSVWQGGGAPKAIYKVTDIEIDKLTDDRGMALTVPTGAVVADVEKGIAYKSNAQGQPVGKVRPLLKERPPAVAQPDSGNPTTETREEPAGPDRWVLLIMSVPALLLLGYGIRRFFSGRRP